MNVRLVVIEMTDYAVAIATCSRLGHQATGYGDDAEQASQHAFEQLVADYGTCTDCGKLKVLFWALGP